MPSSDMGQNSFKAVPENLSVQDTIMLYHPAFAKEQSLAKTPTKKGSEKTVLTPSQLRAMEYRHQAAELFEIHGDSC